MTVTAPAPSRLAASRPPGTPRWWPDAGGLAAGVTLLIVTALWVSNGGIQQLGTASSLGRLAGLWASDLLLLQVLMMARIPLVERAFGQDRLAHWHRWTGFSSFWLLVVREHFAQPFGFTHAGFQPEFELERQDVRRLHRLHPVG